MIGWNIEIIFMFAIAGIVYAHTVLEDKTTKILGIPNRWFFAIAYSAFAVFIECLLNVGGHLVWEYPFWNRSFGGIWLIFFFGYFHFYLAALFVMGMNSLKNKIIFVSSLYLIAIVANVIGMGFLGWTY